MCIVYNGYGLKHNPEKQMKLDSARISTIQNYFKDKPVLKAYLFGSFATDKADETSDIDILVELDYSNSIGLKFIQMQLDLQNLLDKKVDLLSEKGVSKYIQPYIEKDKVLIYAKLSR